MSKQMFCDGVENIAVISGNVRVELFGFTAGATDGTLDHNREKTGTLVMSPEGFLRCCQAFENLKQEMLERGLLKPALAPTNDKSPTSPNFAEAEA